MICTGAPRGPLTPVVRSETSCLRGLSAGLSFESSVGFTIAAGADRIKTELKLDAWTPPPLFLCHARRAAGCKLSTATRSLRSALFRALPTPARYRGTVHGTTENSEQRVRFSVTVDVLG